MSTALSPIDPMSFNPSNSDDLTKIKGIGLVRQQWFREKFNVRTYQDMTMLSAEEIEFKLRVEGRVASRSEIETWLAQAKELANLAFPPLMDAEVTTSDFKENSRAVHKVESWQPFASFAVEFQARKISGQPEAHRTAVHHMETDTDATWSGIEDKELCAWILEQVNDNDRKMETEDNQIGSKPTLTSPIPISITQVRIFQPHNTDTPIAVVEPGQLIQGYINSREPFALEATFQLDESIAVAPQIIYHAQFFVRSLVFLVHSLAIGTKRNLGNTLPTLLIADQTTYTVKLPQISLMPGLYRLQVLVSLQSKPPSLGYIEVPLLQVI